MIHNLVEEHVVAAYDAMRPHFPDFCGCEVCREDALVFTLNRIPARYVSSPTGSVVTGGFGFRSGRGVLDVVPGEVGSGEVGARSKLRRITPCSVL